MTPWLTVIGIGEDGVAGLPRSSLDIIKGADVLVGGERHLAKIADTGADRLDWGKGFFDSAERLGGLKDRKVVVLASGDPMNYGAGTTLLRWYAPEEMTIIPAPGAFALAAARMAWSLPDVDCITVHGRPLEIVNLYLSPGAKLLILSRDGTTPAALAELLTAKGFGDSALHVFERMGGDAENRVAGTARDWQVERTADLNTIALQCVAGDDAVCWPRVPGLPEAAYRHDGKITKREVRAATLAKLAPMPGEMLWDVGAGSGSVAIEWLRCDTSLNAVAFESDREKCDVIRFNAAGLGVPKLHVVEGRVPESLDRVEGVPDAVFVGGGVSDMDLIMALWTRLRPGGRLVANAVTLEAQSVLMELNRRFAGELTRISAARSGAVGSMTTLRPFMDVLQLKVTRT